MTITTKEYIVLLTHIKFDIELVQNISHCEDFQFKKGGDHFIYTDVIDENFNNKDLCR